MEPDMQALHMVRKGAAASLRWGRLSCTDDLIILLCVCISPKQFYTLHFTTCCCTMCHTAMLYTPNMCMPCYQVLKNDRNARSTLAMTVLDHALTHGAQALLVGLPVDPWNPHSSLTNPNSDTAQGRKCRWFAHTLSLVSQPYGVDVYLYGKWVQNRG